MCVAHINPSFLLVDIWVAGVRVLFLYPLPSPPLLLGLSTHTSPPPYEANEVVPGKVKTPSDVYGKIPNERDLWKDLERTTSFQSDAPFFRFPCVRHPPPGFRETNAVADVALT